jgi:integrase
MSRRRGQNPKVRVGKRADGTKYYFFQYWIDVPGREERKRMTVDLVNEWAWKKRQEGVSWPTIKDALRTMQRILSAFMNTERPLFSQKGLAIAERDKLQMKINSRQKVSFSWAQADVIARYVQKMDGLGDTRREQYATLILLAAASGLRSSELLALRVNDVDFQAGTVRVDESSDQRTKGRIGLCKNTTAYRTVVLHDVEGRKAMEALGQFMGTSPPDELIFHSRRKGPLLQTTVLNQGLYPALKALGLPKGGLHAFRRGCNRRWELAKLNPAVIRQQMGHKSERMTAHYTGEIPLDLVRAAFSEGSKGAESENKENGVAA